MLFKSQQLGVPASQKKRAVNLHAIKIYRNLHQKQQGPSSCHTLLSRKLKLSLPWVLAHEQSNSPLTGNDNGLHDRLLHMVLEQLSFHSWTDFLSGTWILQLHLQAIQKKATNSRCLKIININLKLPDSYGSWNSSWKVLALCCGIFLVWNTLLYTIYM